jgi:hypothetical protein
MKRAYATCDHCKREFLSPIQVPEGAKLQGNTGPCPHCKKTTSIDRLFWKDDADAN